LTRDIPDISNDREWNSGGKKGADNTGNMLGLHVDDICIVDPPQ
jgi:hypothetical protein